MIDLKFLRSTPEQAQKQLAKRGFDFQLDDFKQLEFKRKQMQEQLQELQNDRNVKSKQIGQAKAKGQDTQPLLDAVAGLSEQLKSCNQQLDEIKDQLDHILWAMPNIADDDVPVGSSEDDNEILSHWGEPTTFNFTPKDHMDLGEALGGIDFNTAAKLAGSRFPLLRGPVALLHRALVQFMLNMHTNLHGYQELYVPYLVKNDCYFGTGQLPKFAEDFFTIAGGHDLSLISTAEVPITNTVREQILEAKDLPIKLTAHTPCFRSEAGSYGRDTRGMVRNHQFDKVELVQIVRPEDSDQALTELTGHAQKVLEALELPYRVAKLCTADLGFQSAKTYDLEVWLPGQNAYREISSCSNCRDFQARRMQARFRDPGQKKPNLVHTINGSGLAVGRALVAVLENYQTETGNVRIPDVLRPYMGGVEWLRC